MSGLEKEAIKGRGTFDNEPNRFEAMHFAWDEDVSQLDPNDLPHPKTIFYRDHSKSILTQNDSPDVGFDVSINAYRGCEHGCVYCYARPTHEYLGLSSGLDFETKILVKEEAPALLRKELSRASWEPKVIAMSGVTDCYQPAERHFKLTRGCLEVLLDYRNPVIIITKNALVTRDLDLLVELNEFNAVTVCLSVTTLDVELCGTLEPRTSRPHARLETIRRLSEAGIPTRVIMAPIVPGLTDHEIPAILSAARENGARSAHYVVMRLPYAVKHLFEAWLGKHYPDRKDKVLNRLRELRDGKLNDPNFGSRMRGQGVFAEQIRSLFRVSLKKAGFSDDRTGLSTAHFRRLQGNQMELF